MPRLIAIHLVSQVLHVVFVLLPTIVLLGSLENPCSIVGFACVIMAASFLEGVFVEAAQRGRPARHDKFHTFDGKIRDRLAMRVAGLVGVLLLLFFWLAQVERLVFGPSPVVVCVVGLISMVAGVALRSAAIYTLGPQFISDIQVCGAVVRTGVYRWLGHPSEVGLLLIACGGPLLIGSPLTAILAAAVLIPISRWRMRREDAVLETAEPLAVRDGANLDVRLADGRF